MKLRLGQAKDRLNRLTDAYIDQAIDKTMFEERKKSLLLDQKALEGNLANLTSDDRSLPDRLEKFLELAGSAWLSHQNANPDEKREMLEIFTSNRAVQGKKLDLKPSIPFQAVADRLKNTDCALQRDVPRTWDRLLDALTALNTQGHLPDLTRLSAFRCEDTKPVNIKKASGFAKSGNPTHGAYRSVLP